MIETERDINPPVEIDKQHQIFTYIATIYNKDGTPYVNNTETFPIRSIDVYITIFILYYLMTNEILATPINDTKDETMINEFKTHIKYKTKRGFKPCFNIIDNVTSK